MLHENRFKNPKNEAAWLGVVSSFSGVIAGLVVGILADKLFTRKFKQIVIVMYLTATLGFIW